MIKTAELLNCSLCCNSNSNCSINIAIKINQVFLRTWILKRELRNENKNLPCLQLLSYHVLIDGRKKNNTSNERVIFVLQNPCCFRRREVKLGSKIMKSYSVNFQSSFTNSTLYSLSSFLKVFRLGRKTKSFYGGLRWAVAKQHAGVKVTPRESVYCVRITLLLWICYLMLCRVQCFLDYQLLLVFFFFLAKKFYFSPKNSKASFYERVWEFRTHLLIKIQGLDWNGKQTSPVSTIIRGTFVCSLM